ncbi:ATP-binding cassette domain-containing protein [Lactobacillus sp. PV012]|uniref:ATP-binding cassette domain-containing protein n=1 Tax=Lactobacillus sp. PV012 TaxID=2594494 RepID=UPI0022405A69|nr:ABC transporter ATP-binding protein [Lactobacillus sp. PV012]QNQ82613.1 ABC transporter ATP-binding protein [Lactobacillus sp. PV012]
MEIVNIFDKNILKGVSFSIKKGERLAVIGPNGAGKTTLLNIVSGFNTPIKGKIIGNYRKEMVFQENLLDDNLTIKQNLRMRLPSKKEYASVEKMLKSYGISNTSLKYKELSGGQKRIVNLLRVTAMPIDLLILDELSAGVDAKIRKMMWEILRTDYAEKLAIIYTTHVLEELAYADKILYLKRGKIIYYGDSKNFREKLPMYKLVLNEKNTEYFLTPKKAFDYLEKHPTYLTQSFEIRKVSYEDIFMYQEGE